MSENEEYKKIPPPDGQKNNNIANGMINAPTVQTQQVSAQAAPPSQEEVNWAIQLEENVQKKGYKPSEQEMAKYQEIANRIVVFQQAQVQAQRQFQAQNMPNNQFVVTKKKSKLATTFKFLTLFIIALFFWAKVSIVVLQPSYFVPRGKIYLVIKPITFSNMYYSVNMDKVYEEKLRKGFNKSDLNIDQKTNKKSKIRVNSKWYIDPQYWENHYILSIPYPKFDLNL
ncbi:MAG: hypothetical protein H7263_00885 [Candidatus Sericytochromatia bacterium]|nr:hypothetical protein [Candidatus Sericytochromatia bacterium]